jgi:hypothetical protein
VRVPPRSARTWWLALLARPWLRILVVLTLLHLPWPGLGRLFGSYVGGVEPVLLSPWSPATLKLKITPASDADWHVLFDASDRSSKQRVQASLDIRRSAWLPLATFLALLSGFPIQRRRRRALVAAVGLSILHLLWTLPLLAFLGGKSPHFFTLGETAHTLVVIAYRGLISPPGMVYAVPGLLWFVLSWRLEPELM